MTPPKVSIIVLTYNQYQDTRDCLIFLGKINYPNYEIIVVDNASKDGTAEKLMREFPHIQLIKNSENLGVAGGRNIGAQEALRHGTDYVLFLDNDTVVDPNFLSELVYTAESNPKIAAVSPKIYYFDDPTLICSATGIFFHRISHNRNFGGGKRDLGQYDNHLDADWLPGCANLNKNWLFKKIGFLDEDYSPYSCEDIDWSIRIKRAGYILRFVPSAKIWHKDSPAKYKGAIKSRHIVRGKVIFLRKNVKLYDLPLSICWFILYYLVRNVILCMIKRDWLSIRNIFLGTKDGLLQRTSMRNRR